LYIQSSGLDTALYENNEMPETIILAEDVQERFCTVSEAAVLVSILENVL